MPHLPIAISLAKPVSPCVHDPPRPTLSSVSTSQSRLPCYQLILARVPLTLTPHTPAHQAQGGPSPGPLSLVCSPRQPGPHRSTGTSLGKTRPQGPGQGLKDRRRTPKVQRSPLFPRLGPSLARCSPEEAGEEGLRVLHLALRLDQQCHCLSLLSGVVHDVAQLLGSSRSQPRYDSQARDTEHSAEFRPLH